MKKNKKEVEEACLLELSSSSSASSCSASLAETELPLATSVNGLLSTELVPSDIFSTPDANQQNAPKEQETLQPVLGARVGLNVVSWPASSSALTSSSSHDASVRSAVKNIMGCDALNNPANKVLSGAIEQQAGNRADSNRYEDVRATRTDPERCTIGDSEANQEPCDTLVHSEAIHRWPRQINSMPTEVDTQTAPSHSPSHISLSASITDSTYDYTRAHLGALNQDLLPPLQLITCSSMELNKEPTTPTKNPRSGPLPWSKSEQALGTEETGGKGMVGLNPVGPGEFLERYRLRNSSQRPLFSESFSSSSSVALPTGHKLDNSNTTLEVVPELKEEMPERGQWSGKLDFIFSCISYAVGLGNVWRFPYLCYENGGGAFLVPYLICIFIVGIPLFLMEVSLGQYFKTGGVAIWNRIPILKGVGFASMVMIGLCNTYYIVIIAWTLYYLFNSFMVPLPWMSCGNSWNTEACHVNDATHNSTMGIVSPAQEYWEHKVLSVTDHMGNVGSIQWHLFATLIVAWILVYGVIWRGIHQSGKIIWFTAMFPYVILIILFCYGMSLPGAIEGIIFYISPKWHMLKEAKIWVAAGSQLLFTYGIGIGTNVALGSYNTHNHNFYRDSLIACMLSSATSLFSGFVIFSVLGHMAWTMKTTVDKVATSGPGLAFIVYPEAITRLPLPNLWAILFFVMLLVLGIDSQFCTVESFITGIVDEYPRVLRPRRKLFTAFVVVVHFVLGISMITEGGMYVFKLMDNFSASGITLIFVVLIEVIGFAWIYGGETVFDNMTEMLGFKPMRALYYLWVYVSPAVLLGILIFSVVDYSRPEYNGQTFPWYGEVTGWCIAMASIICIPIYIAYYLTFKTNKKLTLKERFLSGFKPQEESADEANKKRDVEGNNNIESSGKSSEMDLASSSGCSTYSTSLSPDNSSTVGQA